MTVAFVQGTKGSAAFNADLKTSNFGSSVTSGNCLIAFITTVTTDVLSTPTDTGGNTYTQIGTILSGWGATSSFSTSAFIATNVTGAANFSVSAARASKLAATIVVQEFSGVKTSSAVDTSNNDATHSTGGTPLNGAAVTTTNTGDAVVSCFAQSLPSTSTQQFSLGTGYTNLTDVFLTNSTELAVQSQIETATNTYTPTIGDTLAAVNKYGSVTVALLPAPAPAATNSNFLMFM